MSRTVLFFGASNTRGYGIDPAQRFAAILERELSTSFDDAWQFVVSTSPHQFQAFRAKLKAAIAHTPPTILVIQCPTYPLSFPIDFPRWVNALRAVQGRHLHWRRERAVAAEISRDPTGARNRRDALREGRFIESVYRFRLTSRPSLRRLRNLAARRYGVRATSTLSQYLEGMASLQAAARDHFRGPIVFIGLLPMGENGFPGYAARAHEWNRAVAGRFTDAAQNLFFVDVLEPLAQLPPDRLLLSDETHLNIEGHRRLAELLRPDLARVMRGQPAAGSRQ